MRTTRLAILTATALALLVLPTATASERPCPTYETRVGDESNGVGLSHDDGAAVVAAGGFYVLNDATPLAGGSLFSIWIYQESNGEPGPQRDCDGTYHGPESDTIVF